MEVLVAELGLDLPVLALRDKVIMAVEVLLLLGLEPVEVAVQAL
jgi:hypothetical protein